MLHIKLKEGNKKNTVESNWSEICQVAYQIKMPHYSIGSFFNKTTELLLMSRYVDPIQKWSVLGKAQIKSCAKACQRGKYLYIYPLLNMASK